MSKPKVVENMTTIATTAMVSISVFIIGLGLLSVVPLPVHLKGQLNASTIVLSSDAQSSSFILLTTEPDGTPSISINDAQGNNAFFLTVSEKGYPSLDISGPNEAKILSIIPGKQPIIRLYDPSTNTVAWQVVGDAATQTQSP